MRHSSIALLALGALVAGACALVQALDGPGLRGPGSRPARRGPGAIEEASTEARPPRPMTAASDQECPVLRRVPGGAPAVEPRDPPGPVRAVERRARLIGHLVRTGRPAGAATALEVLTGPDRGTLLRLAEDGSFASPPLAAERITLAIRSPRGVFERSLDLRIGRPTVLELDLAAGHRVRGRVLDASGDPVQGAQVIVDGEDTWTDGLGCFALVTRADGIASARVEAPGFALAELALRADLDEVTVTLRPAGRLEVELAGAAPGQEVRVGPHRTGRPEHDTFPWHRLAPRAPDATGVVVFEGLPADWVRIEARDASEEHVTRLARIAPGRTARERLSPTGSVSGRFVSGIVP